MSEISTFLLVSNGNVTGIVDRLVADGVAIRVRGTGDRRKNFVGLTPKGRGAFAKMAAAHERWINELLGQFEGREIAGPGGGTGAVSSRPPRRRRRFDHVGINRPCGHVRAG